MRSSQPEIQKDERAVREDSGLKAIIWAEDLQVVNQDADENP